jgi:hypothetical protein
VITFDDARAIVAEVYVLYPDDFEVAEYGCLSAGAAGR